MCIRDRYGTVHADDTQDTIVRMTNPPIEVPKLMINAIGGIVTLFRHRRLGIRRVLEFAEVSRTGDATVLWRWNSRQDTFVQIGEMARLADTIMLYGGYTRNEMLEEIEEKRKILEWMVKNKVFDVDATGYIIANYYKDKNNVLDIVNKDIPYSSEMFKKV